MQKANRLSFFIVYTVLFSLLFSSSAQTQESSGNYLEHITREAATQGYDKDFIELIEMVYGTGFLSQGGEQSVRNMLGNTDLNGLRVLDIGSGIGGPTIFLAKHYRAHIVGVDPQKWMIDQAKVNLVSQKERLKGTVEFVFMESASNLQQFPSASFDVVFSKESLLHIPREAKQQFFAEIYRVLKPGGSIILMDWMRTSVDYSKNTQKMMELDGVAYNLITQEEYLKMLQNVGFTEIVWEDTTAESYQLSQQNVNTILLLQSEIKTKYDQDIFQESLQSWKWQRDAFQVGELLTGIFKAGKHYYVISQED